MHTLRALRLVFSFTICIVISGCDEDSFTQVLDVEIPEHTPVPVVACEITEGDVMIDALVSHSLGILDTSDFSIVENATLTMFKDNIALFELKFDTLRRMYHHELPAPFELTSGEYRLEASAPGYAPVYATQVTPTPVVITELTFEEEGAILADGSRGHQIDVTWIDPPEEGNYYSLNIYTMDPASSFFNRTFPESLDPTIESGVDFELLIDDSSFNGSHYTARIAFDTFFDGFLAPGGRLIAILNPLTRDGYLYSRSRELYDQGRDNPFVEPVIVHTNIVDGYGIFTIERTTSRSIEF